MGLTPAKVTAVPTRLLAALRRAGMSTGDIAQVYDVPPEVVSGVVASPFEPLCVDDMELLRDDDHRYTLDAYGSGSRQTIRVAKAKSGRPNQRLIRIPRL